MTLKKIAEAVGCSVATVSKAFSGSTEISETVTEKIFEKARELGCYDKYYKGKTRRKIIGLLFPEAASEFYGRQIDMLEREIYERGADTVVGITRFNAERTARLFNSFAFGMRVDGIILSGDVSLIRNPDQIPLVCFHKPQNKKNPANADYLSIDYKGGLLKLCELIKEYGHTNVGFIGEPYTKYKMIHLCEALRKCGLPVRENFFYISKHRFAEAGEDGFAHLAKEKVLPDVIVAGYDHIAFGAIRCAKKMGIKIPEDVSIVGIDDITATDFIDVPLTSLHVHTENACKTVVDLLFKRIDNRNYRENREFIIPLSVNMRESLAKKR